jgi:hypothetical protein
MAGTQARPSSAGTGAADNLTISASVQAIIGRHCTA